MGVIDRQFNASGFTVAYCQKNEVLSFC